MILASWLILLFPFCGALALTLGALRLPRRAVAAIALLSTGASAVCAGIALAAYLQNPVPASPTLYQWIAVGTFDVSIDLHLDALALAMATMVAGVGFLIHVYATAFMAGQQSYGRFFAAMNLFVGFMLTLVLAGNLLLLYLGWEGVGLCSYLLIGFWHSEHKNVLAARKAFVITRIGDTALAVALFALVWFFGTLDIQEVLASAQATWSSGDTWAVLVAALLLVGALAKSAQLPLHTWLPDAMAGPTPVSALIHAATMVTAGVYLIARIFPLMELAPAVLDVIAWLGCITLLLAGLSALTQRDIKRVLAYSTMSQVGYMFLALGVGAGSAAIFHLFTHAVFKAVLFLAAGTVIAATGGEHDIHKLGGLRHRLPVAFWAFLLGGSSLAGLPLVTAGFYSKERIIGAAQGASDAGLWFAGAAILGALITALYIFRVIFLVFFGPERTRAQSPRGLSWRAPLVVLAALSLLGGILDLPASWPGGDALSTTLREAVPVAHGATQAVAWISSAAVVLGVALSYLLFLRRSDAHAAWLPKPVSQLFAAGFHFDTLYAQLFARPYMALSTWAKPDLFDAWARQLARSMLAGHRLLSGTQTGLLRRYASGLALGAVLLIAGAIWL